MKNNREEQLAAFNRLLDVMNELREQCPWDKKQTFDSLRCNTIEEVYDLADSLSAGYMNNIKKEWGDVLLHVVFYARIASQRDAFDITGGAGSLCENLSF